MFWKNKKEFKDFNPILDYQIQQHDYNAETSLTAKANFIHDLAKEYLANLIVKTPAKLKLHYCSLYFSKI
jgi:hypothetical protein